MNRLVLAAFAALSLTACAETLGAPPAEEVAPSERIEPTTVEQPIVNGTSTPTITDLTAGEQLAIGFLADPDGVPFCSGTLISDDVVLTAIHCLTDRSVEDLRFGLGEPSSPRALIDARRVSEADWETDVALVQLQWSATSAVAGVSPLPFNRAPLTDALVGTLVEVSGYAAVSGVSRRRFAALEVTGVSDTSTTADGFGARGACQGDSGGPMLLTGALGAPVVAGTIIGGHTSCLQNVYLSRVDRVAEWIDEELAWFATGGSGTGGGSSQGTRRIPDPCACSPTRPAFDVWTALLAVLIGVLLWRRQSPARASGEG